MADSPMLRALAYAKKGKKIFPIKPRGKTPLTSHGFKDATMEPQQIRRWWTQWPEANIGMPTGEGSGVLVLDVDPRNGGTESLYRLQDEHGRLPDTSSQKTGGQGTHFLFEYPTGQSIRSTTLNGYSGLDIKADGGYILLPPSRTQHPYSWVDPTIKPTPLPPWLLDLIVERSRPNAEPLPDTIPVGRRNTTLASAAGTMRRRGLTGAEINAALQAMNQDRCRPPLPESEVTKIGENVSRYPAGKNALLSPGTQPTISIAEILTKAGFDELTEDSSGDDIERAIRNLGHQLEGADQVRRMVAREEAAKLLSVQLKIKGPMALLDPVLKVQDKQTGKRVMEEQVLEPWPEVVNGAELLDEIRGWIGGYVFAPEESINSIALWAVATWFVEFTYFAPLLTLLSPTIQSGKTLVIDLLEWICRETVRTSGVGITPAVIFRLNEKRQPTFLIDEAEKLSGRNADKEIIGLLNEGYRRGGKVQRCGDKSNNFDVEEFEAFGFRLLASTEKLWGSIIDRSIIVRISRKPRSQIMRR